MEAGGPFKGALFWQWTPEDKYRDSRGVKSSDSTFQCGSQSFGAEFIETVGERLNDLGLKNKD